MFRFCPDCFLFESPCLHSDGVSIQLTQSNRSFERVNPILICLANYVHPPLRVRRCRATRKAFGLAKFTLGQANRMPYNSFGCSKATLNKLAGVIRQRLDREQSAARGNPPA